MKCLVCHWKMVGKKVAVDLAVGDDLLIVESVPAAVCTRLGKVP